MSGLAIQTRHKAFKPEQFEVISDFDDIVIDPKVTADLANSVFARNNPGKHRNNNRMYSDDTPFIIDARWEGYSAWPDDEIGTDEETGYPTIEGKYRVHVPFANADAGTDNVNKTFAWGLQRILDAQERNNRLGQIGSTFMLGVISAAIAGPSVGAIAASEMSKQDSIPASIMPAAVGFKLFGPAAWDTIKHMGRNVVVKPNSIANNLHMKNTLKHVGRLSLDPMLYEMEKEIYV